MPATPDLPPGARPRIWALLAITFIGGALIYGLYGRTETLVLAGIVLGILLYVLLGVELQLRQDRQELGPKVARIIEGLSEHWLLLDPAGVVLHVSQLGAQALGHNPDILTGQRFYDLVMDDPPSVKAYTEMLRFGAGQNVWNGELRVVDEQGVRRHLRVRTIPLNDSEARKSSFVAVGSA